MTAGSLLKRWRSASPGVHAAILLASVLVLLAALISLRSVTANRAAIEIGTWAFLDGLRVLEAAERWASGEDPYSVEGFFYAPVAAVLAAPAAALPREVAIVAWVGLETALVVVGTSLATRGARPALRALSVLGMLGFRATVADLLLANTTIVLVFAVLLVIRGGRMRDGILLGVAAAAVPKPFLVPLLLWALVHRPRAAVGALAAGAVATAFGVLVAGADLYLEFARQLTGFSTTEFVGNEGLSLLSHPAAIAAGIAVAAGLLFVLARRGPVVSLAWATGAGLFVAPYVGSYGTLPLALAAPGLAWRAPALAVVAMAAVILSGRVSIVGAGVVLAIALLLPRHLDHEPVLGPLEPRSSR